MFYKYNIYVRKLVVDSILPTETAISATISNKAKNVCEITVLEN